MVKRILKEVREYKAASIATPLCMIIEVIAEMMIPYLMASIIDKGVNAGDFSHIVKVGGMMIVIAAIGLIGGLAGGVLAAKAATGFAKNLRKAMFERIQSFSFANIDRFSTAGLVTRLTTDVNTLQMGYQMALRMMMRAPASLIVALIMSFVINSRIALIYLFAVLILSLVLYLIISNAMKYFKQAFPKYDALNESVQENVSAIRVVKAYVREEQEINKFKKASQAIYDIFSKAEGMTVFQMPAMMLTVYSCIILISWFGAKMIVSDSLTTGQLMSLLAYCMNILMSLMMVSMIFIMFSIGSAAIERIYEVLEEKSTIDNPKNPVYEVKNGSIDFENVNFAYNESAGTGSNVAYANLLLYHVASKVDVMWNVKTDLRDDMKLTYLEAEHLYNGACLLFKPNQNEVSATKFTGGYSTVLVKATDTQPNIGTQWNGRAYFYTIPYKNNANPAKFPLQLRMLKNNDLYDEERADAEYYHLIKSTDMPSDAVYVPWVRCQMNINKVLDYSATPQEF